MIGLNQNKQLIKWGLLIILFASFCTTGCINALKTTRKSPKTLQTIKQQPVSLYYDFGDVLIPKELKIVQSKSFIYRTGGNASGVMVLKGRVELTSLINFFANNMAKDSWKLISTFKSPRTLMLFQKDNRWCVIYISEGKFSFPSNVEIWVAPAQGDSGMGPGFSETLLN